MSNVINLHDHIERRKIIAAIEQDVDAFCRAEFEEDPRKHLGASVIGDDCQAKAWNAFRWLKFEEFDGRMLRLFNRGHEEEHRFVRWLKGIGFDVRELDEDTKKQYRIVGSKGHFGGSLDGMAMAPARYRLSEALLLEFKTHNDTSFNKLKKSGVIISKPMHYKQMCSYGRAYKFNFALYCAVNKNNDALHFEIVPLDYSLADDLFRKAEGIVFARTRPPKIAKVATYIDCKQCTFAELCHGEAIPSKNCRSCARAVPVENAEWFCELHGGIIPQDFIPKACAQWTRIA